MQVSGGPWWRCRTVDLLQRSWKVTLQETARMQIHGCETPVYQCDELGYTCPNPWPNIFNHYCLVRWVLPYVACSPSCPPCEVGTRSPNHTTKHHRIHFQCYWWQSRAVFWLSRRAQLGHRSLTWCNVWDSLADLLKNMKLREDWRCRYRQRKRGPSYNSTSLYKNR